MEKRVALAIFISSLILLLYNIYYYQDYEPPKVKKPTSSQRIKETPLPFIPKIKLAPINIQEEDLYIETELINAKLTPQGGLRSWKLKRYLEKDKRPVEMIESQNLSFFPLDLSLPNRNLVLCDFTSIDRYTKQFTYQIEGIPDVRLKKGLTFYPDKYEVKVDLKIENSKFLQSLGPFILWGGFIKEEEDKEELIEQGYFIDNQIHKVYFKEEGFFDKIMVSLGLKEKEEPQEQIKKVSNFSWIAQGKRYFSTIILPTKSISKKEVHFRKGKDGIFNIALVLPNITAESFRFYIGPKEYELLETFKKGCERIVYSGWLAPFSRLIIKTLELFYLITRNYGVAIILLTIVIKIILFPLNQISFRSMKSLQELRPHMDRIRQRYKNDRERLNREIIALYKRHGINPIQPLTGGCLPMLLQLPILFALFTTFQSAIELRGAPFIFWLKDLSTKDPYYVLPILMGVSTYVQQKMIAPSQVEPKQPNMAILFITIFFTFICIGFPSGLVLYWLVQNILTIGQQYLIIRKKKSVVRNKATDDRRQVTEDIGQI